MIYFLYSCAIHAFYCVFFSAFCLWRCVFFLSFLNAELLITQSTLSCVAYDTTNLLYAKGESTALRSKCRSAQTSAGLFWFSQSSRGSRALEVEPASSSPKWNHTAGSWSCHGGKAPPCVRWLHYTTTFLLHQTDHVNYPGFPALAKGCSSIWPKPPKLFHFLNNF